MRTAEASPSTWSLVAQSLNRPYPVSFPMLLLVSLVPCYIFIASVSWTRTLHVPEIALDRFIPLQPAWALIYGVLYVFLILLPFFTVREADHLRRTVLAYLTVWITAFACFLVYPTISPRPAKVIGRGFAAWGLRFLYSADPPYNCFPSIHVAHSFVSAFTCRIVHRRIGILATVGAALVALSTLFIKQHYILDVVAGIALAGTAYGVFLRTYAREKIPAVDRRLAPIFALGVFALVSIGLVGMWVAYELSGDA
jgi:membrane-associated phospholipid phosphatase